MTAPRGRTPTASPTSRRSTACGPSPSRWCCCSTTAGCGGGYLGVSVFFTLSGYLITSLALGEHERTGRLDVGAFYGRRLRRLLPASLACLAGIVVLAAVGLFDGVDDLRRDLWGALAQVYNWVALAERADATPSSSPPATGRLSPVDHYWSLAIEEQFYWVWPVVLVVVLRAGRRGRLLARRPAMTARRGRRRPADRRRLGPRRGVLGDAGPPRRDPRRGAAGRRAARSPPRRRRCRRRRLVAGRRRPRRDRAGRPSTWPSGVRPGLRGLAAGVRRGLGGADRRPAGAVAAAAGARRRAARRPRARSATACTSTTGRCTSCSTASGPGCPRCRCSPCGSPSRSALAVVSYRAPRAPDPRRPPALAAGPAGRAGRRALAVARRRRRRAGRLDAVLDALATPRRRAATLAPVDSVAELRVVDPPRRRPPTVRRRPHRRPRPRSPRPTTAAADDGAGHDDRRHDDRDDAAAGADRAAAADRPVAPGADHGRRRLDRHGDGRRDAGVGRRSRRRRPRRRAGRAGLRVHPRRRHPDRRATTGSAATARRCGPSGSRQPCRRCSPTSSSGWSRCATSRTACGTTPRARSARPTTASSPASSPTTTRRRRRSSPPGPRTCCGCWHRSRTLPFNGDAASVARPAAIRPLRGGDARGRRSAPRPGDRRRSRRLGRRPAGPAGRARTACTGRPRRREAIADRLPRPGRRRRRPCRDADADRADRPRRRPLRPAAPRALVPHRAAPPSAASGSPCSSTAAAPATPRPASCGPPGSPSCTPTSRVVEVVHDLPTDFGDEAPVAALDRPVPRPLAVRARTATSCAPATPTSRNWPGASAPSQSSSMPIGRTSRSARR